MRGKEFLCFLAVVLVGVIAIPAFGQSQFVKALGGSDSDQGRSVIEVSDGGFVVAGFTLSYGAGSWDLLLTKFDCFGNHLWARTLGATNDDLALSVTEVSDGGFVVAGYTYSYGAGYMDLLLTKFDGSGNWLWTRTVGGTDSDVGYSVIEVSDGGLVVAGYTYSYGAGYCDLLLTKFDGSGNHLWTRTVGGASYDVAISVIEVSGGGLIVAGHAQSWGAGSYDFLLSKFDAYGNHLWTRTLGGATYDVGYSVIEVSDGGLVVAGYTTSYGAGSNDLLLSKFDGSGNHLWTRTVGGTNDDIGFSVVEASDGGVVVAGYTGSYGAGSWDFLLTKLDGSGNHLWTRTVGGTDSDVGYSVVEVSDGGFVVAGYTQSYGTGYYDFLLAKFDGSGNTCWQEVVIPLVQSISPTITFPSPTVNSWSPTITSPSPTVTSPDPTTVAVCEIYPDIDLSATSYDYGEVMFGDSADWTLFIYNRGTSDLSVSDLTSENTDFAVVSPSFPQTVDSEDSIGALVRFTPSELGERVDTLTIFSNDPDELILLFPLSGIGRDATGPSITHDSITSADEGNEINITAAITDEVTGVEVAFLYYRRGGEATFVQQTMQNTDEDTLFQATIPGASVTERGVQYYISATDSASNRDSTDVYPVSVSITDLAIDEPLPSESYMMISLPIQPSDGSPQAILVDDLGAYDDTKWRLGRWSPASNGYHEYTVNWNATQDNFRTGRGYWLIVKDSKRIDVSGTSVDVTGDYTIVLQPEWNQIGCPFAFDIWWDGVIKGENVQDYLYRYHDGGYKPAPYMKPWQGYWVRNLGSVPDTIWVPPTEAGSTLPKAVSASSLEKLWEIKLSVRCGSFGDGYNYLGVSPDASDEWDRLDFFEPPPAWTYVSLYFPHKDQRLQPGDYTTDFRPEFDDGQIWEFDVKTNISLSDMELNIDQIESVPTKFEVYLFDIERHRVLNLRDESRYCFNSGESDREFRVAIGTPEYIHKVMGEFSSIPAEFSLSQNYPNPFNPTTAISYQLSGVSPHPTTLKIYNILGQEVRTLVDREQAPGYYSVRWDGRDGLGKEVSSGVYFYRLKAGNYTQIKRMILLK